jgi:pimeloyl-ACP methyl ester carboxylesterase
VNYSFLTYQDFTLPYVTYGSGSQLLFAFHGFGRSATDFKAFEQLLGKKYTIIAFDLFYHGNHALSLDTHLPAFELSVMARMIEMYMWENKRVKFSLMGYSFGGKIVLGIVQKMSPRITEVFLLAPDGLKRNPLYSFLSNTIIGNWLLRGIVQNPNPVLKMNNLMLKSKLIHEKVHEFIYDKLAAKEYRKLVYRTWLTFRFYKPSLNDVAKHINRRKIRFLMFFGKHDYIIPVALGERFQRKLKNKNSLIILDCGHRVFYKADEIAKVILKE